MTKRYDVIGIGNAIVDVLATVDETVLQAVGLTKGSMTLISEEQAKTIYGKMGQTVECSGGSAANTIAAFANLGGKAGFIGKVFDDQLGTVFRHDMQAIGVEYPTPATTEGKATAVSMIMVTPDAQRTMATFIGASAHVARADVSAEFIGQAKAVYLEGYLWDMPETKEALRQAAVAAHAAGAKVAFTLSDGFCVGRHHEEFLALIKEHVDWLFANEEEAKMLTGAASVEEAAEKLRGWVEVAAITRSAQGSLLLRGTETVQVKAVLDGTLTDTTGAGDAYAAGVLYGLTHGFSLKEAGELGSRLAGHIICQLGARSTRPLKPLLTQKHAA